MLKKVLLALGLATLAAGCTHPLPVQLQDRAHALGELLDGRDECRALKNRADGNDVKDEAALRGLYNDATKSRCLNRDA